MVAEPERYTVRAERWAGRRRLEHTVVLRAGVGLREAAALAEEWAATLARAGAEARVALCNGAGRCLEEWRVAGGRAETVYSVAWREEA